MDAESLLGSPDQTPHEARGGQPAEHVEGQAGGVKPRGLVDGQPESEGEPVVGHGATPLEAMRLAEGRERHRGAGVGRGARREVTKRPLDRGIPILEGDVTAEGEHRVVRPVPAPEEGVDVVEARRVEVGHRADRRVVVGVAGRKEDGVHVGEDLTVGRVVVTLPLLLLDDVALVVEIRLGDGIEKVAVTVGFEPQGQVERARGHGFEVIGAVEPGRRVEAAALGEEGREMFTGGHRT